jgi:geranylgeranyl reductase
MLTTQVLVIGGGPAGAASARALANKGIDSILLERDLNFSKPCGGGIPSTAFKELSLPEKVIKRLVNNLRIVSPSGTVLDIPLKGGSIAIVERREFDSTLREEAKKAGVNILQGEFRRFSEISRRIVSEVVIDGEVTQIRSDYVIAADGVNSRARLSAGMRPQQSFITLSVKISGQTDSCEFWLSSDHAPRLYSWVFPTANGLSVGTGIMGDADLKEAFRRFLLRRGLYGNGAGRGYKIPLWQGDIYNKRNIIFAGDAAGQVMPLSFEGIYYAMKSGEIAAEAIIDGKIKNYEKHWKKLFYKRFLLMRLLWEYFLKDDKNAERLVDLLKRPDLQEASMRLWLRKDLSPASLISYIKHFKFVTGKK